MRILIAAAVLAVLFALGASQFFPTAPAVPPARRSYPAGPAYAAATRYLAAHPQHAGKHTAYGILVTGSSPGWASQDLNGGSWHGTVIIPGGRVEYLSSDDGDNGMASFAAPGDLISFPAGGPVDAPGDGGSGTPARVLLAGAVGFARPGGAS